MLHPLEPWAELHDQATMQVGVGYRESGSGIQAVIGLLQHYTQTQQLANPILVVNSKGGVIAMVANMCISGKQ
jgi:hypothetical protein